METRAVVSVITRNKRYHRAINRVGWLRAAVLRANNGIVSTASLIIGVAAASSAQGDILLAGMAELVAGAMSMAAGVGHYLALRPENRIGQRLPTEHPLAGWVTVT